MAELNLGSLLDNISKEDMASLQKTAQSLMDSGALKGILGAVENGQADVGAKPVPPAVADGAGSEADSAQNILSALTQNGGFSMPDLSMLSNLAPVLQAFNARDDRIDFINALRPLLSQERRQKADEAMKIVKLLSVLPLLRERGML